MMTTLTHLPPYLVQCEWCSETIQVSDAQKLTDGRLVCEDCACEEEALRWCGEFDEDCEN